MIKFNLRCACGSWFLISAFFAPLTSVSQLVRMVIATIHTALGRSLCKVNCLSIQPTIPGIKPNFLIYFAKVAKIKLFPFRWAILMLPDGIILRLAGGTEITLEIIENTDESFSKRDAQQKNNIWSSKWFYLTSRTLKHFKVKTPIVNASPLGTEFSLKVAKDQVQKTRWIIHGVKLTVCYLKRFKMTTYSNNHEAGPQIQGRRRTRCGRPI